MIGAVVLAGGMGKRMNAGINKQYLQIDNRSVLSYAIESMAQAAEALIVVVRKGEEDAAKAAIAASGVDDARVCLVEGGSERQDSVRNALKAMPEAWEKVLIHDGARPFVPKAMLARILDVVGEGVGVVPGTAVTDTIKRVDSEGFIVDTPPRDDLRAAQTPQCFMAKEILALHLQMEESGKLFTDDALLYEEAGKRVRMVDGDLMARKLTVQDDFLWANDMKEKWEAQK